MEQFLKDFLIKDKKLEFKLYWFEYTEDTNDDALTDAWLESNTSYIYKVGVMAAIDRNKCDFVHVAIATKRHELSSPELKGYFHFKNGENDDMGNVINRALKCLQFIHPAFNL